MRQLLCCVLVALSLSACNFDTDQTTPTLEGVVEEPINPLPEQPEETPSPTVTVSPSASPTQVEVSVLLASPTPSPTPGTPTATHTLTPTIGPWEYVVQSGDSLTGILARPPYNYDPFSNPGILDQVINLNNLASANAIRVGQTLFIPRPTPTPVPEGVELTRAVIEALGGDPNFSNSIIPPGTQFDCYTVVEGDTAVGIVQRFSPLTLELLCETNRDNISCFGCNFEVPSGGPDCNIFLSEGQCVSVPLPTPTHTLSPTPSGSETPTPTPTYRAPSLVYPPNGGLAPAGQIELQWVSVGVLEADEYYLIEVIDTTAETAPELFATRNTSYRLPTDLIPTGGNTHTMSWSVRVAVRTDGGVYAPIGAPGEIRTFRWQSR